jgi:hypothetical protein
VLLSASFADPDGDALTATFTYWPVDDPSQRATQEWLLDDPRETIQVAGGELTDGLTYAWTVRASDGVATSPDTVPCHFTVDKTEPVRPSITSTDYPQGTLSGGPTVLGEFTFTANGSTDVVGFRYRQSTESGNSEWRYVEADQLGGDVTVSIAPVTAGLNYVEVNSVDRAGTWGEGNWYGFDVLEIRPYVYSAIYGENNSNPQGGYGKPGDFRFTSNLTDVVAYRYQHDDAAEQTVNAAANRTATITLAPTRGGVNVLTVRSVSADGSLSPARVYRFRVDTAPTVTIATPLRLGSASQITFTPRRPAVVAHEYRLTIQNVPEAPVTVPARPDGSATITWTPTRGEWGTLEVRSQDADGTWSEWRSTNIQIDGVAPTILRSGAGSPGEPGVFQFSSPMENVVAYRYYVNDHTTAVTVPAAADGTAQISWTPSRRGYHQLIVWALNANGVESAFSGHYWFVTDRPVVSSPDYPENGTAPLRPGVFTFTPRLPGTVAYEYSLTNAPFTEVAAAPNGTATLTLTPAAGSQVLRVRSRDAAGYRSEITNYRFTAS